MRGKLAVITLLAALALSCSNGGTKARTASSGETEAKVAADAYPQDFTLTFSQVVVTGNSVQIDFTTAIPATAWVEFGKTRFTENKLNSATVTTSHSLVLNNLEKGRYFFKLVAISEDGSKASAVGGTVDYSFLVNSASLAQISTLSLTHNGNETTLTFTTDIATQAAVDVGSTTAYSLLSESESGFQKNHTLTFSTGAGVFFYRIRLIDDEGYEKTDDNSGAGYTFTLANPEPVGSKLNPIVVDTAPLATNTPVAFTHSATTVGANSNYIQGYAPYSNAGDYSGHEVIYTFTVAGPTTFSASLAGDTPGSIDNDIQLITALEVDGNNKAPLYANSVDYRADTGLIPRNGASDTLPAGTYYIVIDAYKPAASAPREGAYTLTVNLTNVAPAVGTALNPIDIPAGTTYNDSRNTVGATSRIFNVYPGYAQNESGAEFIYRFTLTGATRVTATLSGMAAGVDIDIHLLNSLTLPLSAAQVLARDDKTLTKELAAGTYYLVADTYVNSSGERKGAFNLTVSFSAVTPQVPGSPLTGGGTSGGADGVVTVTGDDTPADIKATGKVLHPTRQLILDTARTYVGRVSDLGGSGGFKLGWTLLKDIYDTSYHTNVFTWGQMAIDGIKLPYKKINSWCGIFAVAMVRKGGVDAANWQTGVGPKGIASSCRANDGNFTPGDILVMKGSLVHHNLFVSKKSDGSMTTIDGNQINQTITLRTNLKSADVLCYYTPIAEKYVDP